ASSERLSRDRPGRVTSATRPGRSAIDAARSPRAQSPEIPDGATEEESMAWNIEGSYVETCSCDLICPCNATMDHGATYDYCRVVLVFSIRTGEIEGTDVSGLNVAAIADTPKVMTEGGWKLGVFIDDHASDEQMNKLVQVFGGQLGGPMA